MPDKSIKSIPASFNEKLLSAQSIKEALSLLNIAQEKPFFLKQEENRPLTWNVDKPLCQHCLQELAVDENYCPLCKELLKRTQALEDSATAGVLTHYEHAHEFMDTSEPSVLLNKNEFLAFLPHFKVAGFLNFLKETAVNKSPIINIVFTGRGDMLFCDALAMASQLLLHFLSQELFYNCPSI